MSSFHISVKQRFEPTTSGLFRKSLFFIIYCYLLPSHLHYIPNLRRNLG